jgi:hypothetical protein
MTKFTLQNSNRFLAIKLPSAYFSGIRVSAISDDKASATVKHRWINQNPFNSLYWATQGMAAELVTGLLVMKKIKESNQNISMLLVKQESHFTKKARGKITFCCDEGKAIDDILKTAISSGEGQILLLKSSGVNEANEMVSEWVFTWSLKLKT